MITFAVNGERWLVLEDCDMGFYCPGCSCWVEPESVMTALANGRWYCGPEVWRFVRRYQIHEQALA